ncbi:hypothetical protein [Arthrobacter sp. efr-133-TYG-120]|uniref:hypothetical protein n=1 Tax=Arthrobacter sp. efr-133-TYG-120 TaxID=3040280 RepID=UPI002550A811|nr:hypothetical protein [Arthrobacter sp. efr-133-TYG-120]
MTDATRHPADCPSGIPNINLGHLPSDLSSKQMFLDKDGAALQIGVAGGQSHDNVEDIVVLKPCR